MPLPPLTLCTKAKVTSQSFTVQATQLQNCLPSHSGFPVQQRGLLPAPAVQPSPIRSNVPWPAYTKSIKRFLVQEIDGSCAPAPLTTSLLHDGFRVCHRYHPTYFFIPTISLCPATQSPTRPFSSGVHSKLARISLQVHSPLSSHRFIH